MDKFRLDYVFSYWIFAWFIFYYYKIIKYSPLFSLVIASIENIIVYFYLIYKYLLNKTKYNYYVLIEFLIVNLFIKVLPIYYILYIEKKEINKIEKKDILFTLLLFIIYIIWLIINNKFIIIKKNKIINNLPKTKPLYELIYYYFIKNK